MAQDGLFDFLFGSEDEEPQPQGYVIDTSAYEARQAERQAELEAAGWTPGLAQQLEDYCDLFEIPLSTTETYPMICLQVLLALFLIPLEDSEDERRDQGNELRQVMAEHMNITSRSAQNPRQPHDFFFGRVNVILSTMWKLPAFFEDFRRSPQELVDLYLRISRALKVMKMLGIGAPGAVGVSATRRGFNSGVTGYRDALDAGTSRLRGAATGAAGGAVDGVTLRGNPIRETISNYVRPHNIIGPLSEADIQRNQVRTVRGGIAGTVILVTAMAAYENGERRLELIEDLLEIHYREGRATQEQYAVIFSNVEPDQINLEKYWE